MPGTPDTWGYLAEFFQNQCPGCWSRDKPGAPGALEGGIDFSSNANTPVYALGTGPVIARGCYNMGGLPAGCVITQRINVPGYGQQDIYYQHIGMDPGTDVGQMISAGQKIGWVGGHDVDAAFGPHVEIGFNAGWGGPWGGGMHPNGTQWVSNPRPMIQSLVDSFGKSTGTPSPPTTTTTTTGFDPFGIGNSIQQSIDSFRTSFINFAEEAAIFIIALIIIILGVMLLAGKQIGGFAKSTTKTAEKGAILAA